MMLRHDWLLFAAVIALVTTAAGRAQEAPPGEAAEEAKSYYDLRRSADRVTSYTADRYLALAKLQEWSDASGKSKVIARYVEHDPDLKWVKLEAVRDRDGKREVKEITVPVEKLSKTCQSRVRQIDKLKQKLDALLTSGDTTPDDPGAPMTDEAGNEPVPAGPDGPVDIGLPQGPTGPPRVPMPEEPFHPDPMGFAEMDLGPPPGAGPPGGAFPALPPGQSPPPGAAGDSAIDPGRK